VAEVDELSPQPPLRFEIEWEAPTSIAVAELDTTWCNLQIWVGDRCVTRVDSADSGVRQGVQTSAYPLAEWIARNWWSLTQELRPSIDPPSGWSWLAFARLPWLSRHNIRAAGDGMPWPDLTIVPEGSITTLRWLDGLGVAGQPIRFLESGIEHVSSAVVERALRRLVQQVIDRLDQAQLVTTLHKEWQATTGLDSDEVEFARAAAKLGLDPFDVPPSVASDLIDISLSVSGELLDEFLDSADPANLRSAARWLAAAREALAVSVPKRSTNPVVELRDHAPSVLDATPVYRRGYALARGIRRQFKLDPEAPFTIEDWVASQRVDLPPAGLQGLVHAMDDDRVGLALPLRTPQVSERFAQARALGLALTGGRSEYLLDPTRSDQMRLARAFAAELLAPAEGVDKLLREGSYPTEDNFEQIASMYGVSPLLIRHQYDNQVHTAYFI
jgi:hypothetical protein